MLRTFTDAQLATQFAARYEAYAKFEIAPQPGKRPPIDISECLGGPH